MKPELKIGTLVERKKDHTYPRYNDGPDWTATIASERRMGAVYIVRDTYGNEATWDQEYFRVITKLEKAMK